MQTADVLNLLGSIAVFLFGIKVMSDALVKLAGNRLRQFIVHLSSNRLRGVLTGMGITALMQSSTATSLMIVSFSSAGLLGLTEAISMIMGANIGTTFTAWIVALVGFRVKLTTLVLPFTMAGFILSAFKTPFKRHLGHFIVGFCLLFLGLEMIKGVVPDIKSSPSLMHFLSAPEVLGLTQIFWFMAVGAILTVVLQSSSATMAVTLVAAAQGVIGFEAAAAMVLGENIGTTVTPNIAAMVSGVHGRRAALSHLIFNGIGVVWALIVFTPFSELCFSITRGILHAGPENSDEFLPIALSVFHSSFNILNTLLLVGLSKYIADICRWVFPAKPAKHGLNVRPRHIKPNPLGRERLLDLTKEADCILRHEICDMLDMLADTSAIARTDRRDRRSATVEAYRQTRVRPLMLIMMKAMASMQSQRDLSVEEKRALADIRKVHQTFEALGRLLVGCEKELTVMDKLKSELAAQTLLQLRCLLAKTAVCFQQTNVCDNQLADVRQQVKAFDDQLANNVESELTARRISIREADQLLETGFIVVQISYLSNRACRKLIQLQTLCAEPLSSSNLTHEKLSASLR
ncbi:Uncharacterised protein [BD1-7 clade bacterium]|uniref:PhoU domain-containing protein n=1 Tax=BD1-7 clade bacterium TaxID=2029982 RepID=A0A5S9P661_9GAMM|nr:Uncharacterised protein [BD1-7 clade bacterium]CAA0099057.1 Uncharacterised protein [BD1-7 clade bacterium]